MRIAVVGSRTYPNLQQVRNFVNSLPDGTEVVSGGAVGVDITAQNTAAARGLPVKEFLPRFKREGTPYTPFDYLDRNSEIVAHSEIIVAFPFGDAKGTTDTISKALRARKRVQTFEPDDVATWDTLQAILARAGA